ncbi:gluconolactonase [Maribacter sedimenticola]|uniref:Gluconolactonase n=1 Tax=Maribacter sedimenticola TaxID=228956 RepID=A0ABY1SKM0_9FLAO|nr:SMP-30/gluconolactonase/LRE family protein [Maribacter sedimenticola]SNR71056.1 gluconolactonase [Maribacter sedimenticola]
MVHFKITLKSIFIILLVVNFCSCTSQSTGIIAEGAELSQIANTFSFTEGPAANEEGDVFFTDQPNDQILKWSASKNTIEVFKKPSGRANGLYVDHKGNLLAAADEHNELWQIGMNGNIDTLITQFEGKKLNGPNDLWVDLKGGIYFTDPYYQRPYWDRTTPDIKEKRVYYVAPNRKDITIAAEGFVQPNGIIGTADGKTLYIADIGAKKTYSFTINDNGDLTNKTLFTEMGSDGMTIDHKGNVYLTGDGVTVFNKDGKQIAHIPVNEEWTANVTFGGKNQETLFITAKGAVYTLRMNVHGVRYPMD